ncbi:hypothetical protein [Paraburkholderia tropica]|uniref:hypothetical protein n=2 Tax=Paraburkholderia tropica TaxID=92647 RepID=UPI002AB7962A|nr:hypothetical protein [Paraburkholderia tropica]
MNVDKLSHASQSGIQQTGNDTHTPRPDHTSASTSQMPSQLSALSSRSRSGSVDSNASGNEAGPSRFRASQGSQGAQNASAGRNPNLIHNDTNDTQFFPLVNELKNYDDKYVYVTHGTPASNLAGIKANGLDPSHGGGRLGAASYEPMPSSDSIGKLKYAHDPNIALKYSNEPANNRRVGVQLEARVKREAFLGRFDGDPGSTYWRAESGGENAPARINDEPYKQSMDPAMPQAANTTRIWSSETNQHIPSKDVRVVGVSVPAHQSFDTSGLHTEYGDE